MKTTLVALSALVLLALPALAQEPPQPSQPEPPKVMVVQADPAAQAFKRFDLNGDGAITWEEYQKVYTGFAALDANKDGKITPDEMKQKAGSGQVQMRMTQMQPGGHPMMWWMMQNQPSPQMRLQMFGPYANWGQQGLWRQSMGPWGARRGPWAMRGMRGMRRGPWGMRGQGWAAPGGGGGGGMRGMWGQPGMPGMPPMPGMPGAPGKPGMQGVPGMPPMPGQPGMHGAPGAPQAPHAQPVPPAQPGQPAPAAAAAVREARMRTMMLGALADGNHDGTVTAEEWSAFKAAVVADDAGNIAPDKLFARLGGPMATPPPAAAERFKRMFDHDGNGALTVADLDAIFQAADKNGDGKLETSELGGRAMMRLGG